MKIFISHSHQDVEVCRKLADALRGRGFEVFADSAIDFGTSIIATIKTELNDSDVFIAIVTENFLNSSWAQAELSSAIFSNDNLRVLPVVVGDVFVPDFLRYFQYRKVSSSEEVTQAVLNDIDLLKNVDRTTEFIQYDTIKTAKDDIEEKTNLLREALRDNQLTLVCGAGVSRASSIPDWNELLVNILNEVFIRNAELRESEPEISGKDLLHLMPQSNLILGKYLKLVLKDDFEKIVKKHLYSNYNQERDFEDATMVQGKVSINYALETSMMKAIVELARPKRNGKRLESIITFNFDDLIENALAQHQVEYCSIWKEGQIYEIDQLPIYHVHGFLPNKDDIQEPNLVFSEEAYHSQFIDPYSWSNLIQLNTFSANVCLFVGISLSDPNLRRLLDISWRKNQRCRHYIIIRKPPQKSKADEITMMLFEQDANSLGLNVIWCSDFSEIPNILNGIVNS